MEVSRHKISVEIEDFAGFVGLPTFYWNCQRLVIVCGFEVWVVCQICVFLQFWKTNEPKPYKTKVKPDSCPKKESKLTAMWNPNLHGLILTFVFLGGSPYVAWELLSNYFAYFAKLCRQAWIAKRHHGEVGTIGNFLLGNGGLRGEGFEHLSMSIYNMHHIYIHQSKVKLFVSTLFFVSKTASISEECAGVAGMVWDSAAAQSSSALFKPTVDISKMRIYWINGMWWGFTLW